MTRSITGPSWGSRWVAGEGLLAYAGSPGDVWSRSGMDFETVQPGDQTWFLAAWDFRAGTFERLTEGGARMDVIDVATDVVEDENP